jgi:hypothetical protein
VRALVPFLIVVAIGLVGMRLYFAAKMEALESTRTRKILWKMIDVFLVIVAAGGAAALAIFLAGVVAQMWENFT